MKRLGVYWFIYVGISLVALGLLAAGAHAEEYDYGPATLSFPEEDSVDDSTPLAPVAVATPTRVQQRQVRRIDPSDCKSSEAAAVTCYVNAFRASNNLRPLVLDESLTRYSRYWADQMHRMQIMDHAKPFGDILFKMAPGTKFYENIADEGRPGGLSPYHVVELWKDSRPHAENMLRPDMRKIGVGHTGKYWAADFSD